MRTKSRVLAFKAIPKLGQNTHIVILPCSLMFWTNWNEQSPSIMRATLSGSNVLVIIGNDIRTPNGLAIDHRAEKLYFSDATLDKIERCEYDGTRRYVSDPNKHRQTQQYDCVIWLPNNSLFILSSVLQGWKFHECVRS